MSNQTTANVEITPKELKGNIGSCIRYSKRNPYFDKSDPVRYFNSEGGIEKRLTENVVMVVTISPAQKFSINSTVYSKKGNGNWAIVNSCTSDYSKVSNLNV